jgi:hypothetical protein
VRVFSYREDNCKSVEIQGGYLKFPLNKIERNYIYIYRERERERERDTF